MDQELRLDASAILAALNNYIENSPDLVTGLLARNPRLVLNIRSVLPEAHVTDNSSSIDVDTTDHFNTPSNVHAVMDAGPSWLGSSVLHTERSIVQDSLPGDLPEAYALVSEADVSPDNHRLDKEDPGDSPSLKSEDSINSFQTLRDLAKTLYSHYITTHELDDLNNAIELARKALRVALSSDLKVLSISEDLMAWLRARHKQTGDLTDLEEMTDVGRRGIAAMPNEHPILAVLLDKTMTQFSYKFEFTQSIDDLSEAIDLERRAVDLTSEDNARFPVFLNNLAALLGQRYRLMHNSHDLEQSIGFLRQALSKLSENSPFLGAVWCTIGVNLGDEYQRTSSVDILKEAIRAIEKAVAVTPKDHSDYSSRTAQLAMQLKSKFSHTGVRADLEEAVQMAKQAVAAMSENDPNAGAILATLGGLLLSRYRTSEHIHRRAGDLAEAIELTTRAIAATPPQHADLASWFHNLSVQLGAMHIVTGDISELEEAIGLEKRAIDMTPENNHNLIDMYQNLNSLQGDQYGFTGELAHLSECIEYAEKAIAVASKSPPAMIVFLTNLSVFCHDRFIKSGSFNDLAHAISAAKRAIAVTSDDKDLSLALYNLGVYLHDLCVTDSSLANLDEYVDILRQTVAATSSDHHDLLVRQRNLAIGLRMYYEENNESRYMDEAFNILREAVSSATQDHPDLLAVRSELIKHLSLRCESSRDLTLIDKAVQTIRENITIAAKQNDSKERMIALVHLSEILVRRYICASDLSALEEAIQASRQAVAIATELGEKLVLVLISLADRLRQWYLAIGRPSDLDEAVRVARRAITLTINPQDDPGSDAPRILATLLHHRYGRTSSQEDIEEAIHIVRQVLEVKPHPRYFKIYASRKPVLLSSLAETLGERYLRTNVLSDQDEAISAARQAVAMSRDHDGHRPKLLHCLGCQLFNRYTHSNSYDSEDLDESIQVFRKLMSIIPSKDPDIIPAAHGLARSLSEKYSITNSLTLLEEAIQLIKSAMDLISVTDPARAVLLNALADFLRERYAMEGIRNDLVEAYECYATLLDQEGANTMFRIHAAKQIISSSTDWRVIRGVSKLAISLLPRLSLRSMNNMDKQFTLSEATGIASDAAAAVLNLEASSFSSLSSGVAAALKLLEQGRGLLGASLQDIRTDTTELKASHPKLEERFIQLRQELELPASRSLLPGTIEGYSLGQGGRRHDAGKEFDELIADIRSLAGFENFLLSPTEVDMLDAAKSGPIVVINVSQFRCDALLVQHDGLQVVPLPELTKEEVEQRAQRGDMASTETLEWLWDAICGPVMEALRLTTSPQDGKWARVWWVPTGPLTHFPLHAAGYHRKLTSETVLDRAISIYSSSITTIISGRRRRPVQAKGEQRVVVVAMEHTPKHASLKYVRPELAEIRRVFETREIEVVEPAREKDAVIHQLQGCHVFHFAGHGRSDAVDASQSGLFLEDGILKVADVYEISLQEQSPYLAYLSACETGRIKDSQSADENIHLISAFQLAGFRHVIGTLWEVNDKLCVEMARIVYQEIVEGGVTDESVAFGLHRACRQLRDQWCFELANKTRARSIGDTPPIPPRSQEHGDDNSAESIEVPVLERDIILVNDQDVVRSILWVPYVHFGV